MNNPADTLAALAGGHLSHEEVANKVRMLMRTDLDHEAVCTIARDRIKWLASRVAEMESATASLKGEAEPRKPDGYAYRYPHHDGDTVIRLTCGQEINGVRPIEAVPYFYGTPPAPQAAKLDRCPGCYRPKARNADDCAAGCCAKWYAVRDGEAAAECAKLAAFWAAPQAVGGREAFIRGYKHGACHYIGGDSTKELHDAACWAVDHQSDDAGVFPSPAPQGGGEAAEPGRIPALIETFRERHYRRELNSRPQQYEGKAVTVESLNEIHDEWLKSETDQGFIEYLYDALATHPAHQPGEVEPLRTALAECLDAMNTHVAMYPHMDKAFMVDARKTAAAALAPKEKGNG